MPEPATPNAPAPATHLQLIRIASRVVAAYLLLWALDDLTLVPTELLSLSHELRQHAATNPAAWGALDALYYVRYSILYLSANLFRIALWLMGAGWFYRCGPRIQRFFSPETVVLNPEP